MNDKRKRKIVTKKNSICEMAQKVKVPTPKPDYLAQFQKSTWWREITDPHKVSSDLHKFKLKFFKEININITFRNSKTCSRDQT